MTSVEGHAAFVFTSEQLQELLKELGIQTMNHHSNMGPRMGHRGPGWKKCPSQECKEAYKVWAKYEAMAPFNHNPYSFRRVRQRIQAASVPLEKYLQ
jgi:hypothetical protein